MQTNPKLPDLRRQAMALPLLPGVYIMRDQQDHIIYIGKAKALKNRVSQYFGAGNQHPPKVRQMVSQVDHFEYIVADSEFEALVLECSLIKQHKPKYNILLKDDKGYSYIRISPPPYSRIDAVLQKLDDGARYIGPYMSSFIIKQAVEEAHKIFKLATCNRPFGYRKASGRPCLNHYIDQCCAPCTGRISEAEYAEQVNQAVEFLTQGSARTLSLLKERMEQAAERLEFEKAARLRDHIAAIKRLSDKQKVVMSRVREQDVVAMARGNDRICFEVFRFTKGRLSDREHFLIDEFDSPASARAEFLREYYTVRHPIPPQITVDGEVEDAPLMEQWLTDKAKRRVQLHIPQRGEQAHLVEMCRNNAAEHIARLQEISGRDAAALDELARLLGLDAPPAYIESYDISHTDGADNVAGMVVFYNGRPLKSAYRKFKIRSFDGQDDYGSMREVISRRLDEYEKQKDSGEGFGRLPDLILLDGGQGQVGAVRPVLEARGYTVPVFGMVKDSHHRTRAIAADGGEIAIHAKRAAFTLVGTIQEEVHRFAISYHRQKRGKSRICTSLTGIEGVGETRAKALLRHFGSVKAVREASLEELQGIKGMTKPAAQAVFEHFQEEDA
ncbi:MAG: excinuclease ABC subunit UvrC [Acutalibacteraceae bacterium]|jgi:excinuclease ABC subunit C